MPIYEYQCPRCHAVHEEWQSISDAEGSECPDCLIPMRKLISRNSFQLRGGGWYADGYCAAKGDKVSDRKQPADTSCNTEGDKKADICTACHDC